MPFYIVLRKHLKEGLFPSNAKNPTRAELMNDLKAYSQIHLFNSLEDAKNAAESFFHPPREPKVGGSYGLVAEVSIILSGLTENTLIDESDIYNNWVDSQKLNYIKKESSGIKCSCMLIKPSAVESILASYIPKAAQKCNPNLQDSVFPVEYGYNFCSVV